MVRSGEVADMESRQKRAVTRPGSSSRLTQVLAVLALAGVAATVLFGLVLSPNDAQQRVSVRFMYLHVPAANLAYLTFFLTALGGVMHLIRFRRTGKLGWDRLAGAAAEVGLVWTGVTLITGMLWGKMTWGVYWTWDARLTTTALLFVLFLGYLAIRRVPATPEVRGKRSAIAGMIAFMNVPIVHFSVVWWRSLHQDSTIKRLDPTIDGLMLFTLFVGMVAMSLVTAWMLVHRYRHEVLLDLVDERGLEAAVRERLADEPSRPVEVAR
jgi:heme exporter protein C